MHRYLGLTLTLLTFLLFTQLAANVFAAPGDLDSSFGTNGRVRTIFPVNSATFLPRANIKALVVQVDGKIVGAGQALTNPSQGERFIFALVRYNPNGTLDTSFDGDGKTDIAVFRDGIWYLNLSAGGFTGVQFGLANDLPIPANY